MKRLLRRTPLFSWHRSQGARMGEFAGWEMPLWYTRVSEEVLAVRNAAGLFDVSHMGQIEVCGPGALATLQWITTNDASRLQNGQAQYSLLCREDGGVLDDAIVYRSDDDRFFLCVNAANTARDLEWIKSQNRGATVIDRSEDLALLALQGPRAVGILGAAGLNGPVPMRRFQFTLAKIGECPVLLARTGYTGEDGFEVFCAQVHAEQIWGHLLQAGKELGLLPCGLAARDLLRLEAALPLYGHELHEKVTPIEAGLAWAVRFEKGEFVGRRALRELVQVGWTKQLAGMVLTADGIPRQTFPIMYEGERVGEVTSGGKSPTLGKSIALGYVPPALAKAGVKVEIGIRGRAVPATIVALPFYKR